MTRDNTERVMALADLSGADDSGCSVQGGAKPTGTRAQAEAGLCVRGTRPSEAEPVSAPECPLQQAKPFLACHCSEHDLGEKEKAHERCLGVLGLSRVEEGRKTQERT